MGRFEISLSVPLFLEYEEVLMRQASIMGRDPVMVTNLLDYLCAVAKLHAIFYLWRPLLTDANDEMVLELAVAAGGDAIITHNGRHFLLAAQFGVRVLSPGNFLGERGGIP
jgi:predicted nucleic acid-binding protein